MKLKTATLVAIISCSLWTTLNVINNVTSLEAGHFENMDVYPLISTFCWTMIPIGILIFFIALYKNQK